MDQDHIDTDLIDDAVLGLMYLGLHRDHGPASLWRSRKGFDWAALERLHARELLHDPVGKTKSVMLTEEGHRRCAEAFRRLFVRPADVALPLGPKVPGRDRD